MRNGDVKALLVRGVDPMYSLPESLGFRDASYNVPLIVSFSEILDDTADMADLVLPQNNPLEDWGSDMPNPGPGVRMVGFQQPVIRPFFEPRGLQLGTKNFGDVLIAVAQALDMDLGLPGESFKEILQDGVRQLWDNGQGMVGMTPVTSFSDLQSFWNAALMHGFWWDDRSAVRVGSAPVPQQMPEYRDPRPSGPQGRIPSISCPTPRSGCWMVVTHICPGFRQPRIRLPLRHGRHGSRSTERSPRRKISRKATWFG